MALKAWYRMANGNDSSGNGYNLIPAYSPGQTSGKFSDMNGASTFNGSTSNPQYFYKTAMTALNVTDDFTLSACIYPTGLQATTYFGLTNGVFYKGPATTYNWGMQLTNATALSFCKRTGAESLKYSTFTGLPDFLNKWTTVTMVITGGYVNLYLDGEYVTQIAVTNIAPGTSDAIYVGSATGGTGTSVTSFIGYIDDVRMYDDVRTAEQILAIHRQGDFGTINFF